MTERIDSTRQDILAVQKIMQSGDFKAALERVNAILNTHPDHKDALYMQPVCHRYLRQFQAAQISLDRLKSQAPEFGRAYQEEGHLLRGQGKARDALIAYKRACEYNPALSASWKAQAELLQEAGADAAAVSLVKAQTETPVAITAGADRGDKFPA